ncbi:Dihydrolipoamide succinyltransferase component (E2) of 2-oxoglutarate dehydrogenase complex [hydrothermal vent metagenome]|uniref:dihydrolipoyllysine-residue succinyltransferase n=1 Tax=hydrothermal vent metagenome TaxID=652676 RepID=A0A3B0ZVQ0_9ZZZZ
MTIKVNVPSFPESVADGTLVTWHKQVGDVVEAEEILADVETDKVVFEVPAPSDGIIESILIKAGATVLSGETLATLGEVAAGATPKPAPAIVEQRSAVATEASVDETDAFITPAARKMIEEKSLDAKQIQGTGKGGSILKEDVIKHLENSSQKAPPAAASVDIDQVSGERLEKRVPMTRLRKRIAERLLESQSNAAILTTFNEVNMQPVMELRAKYKEAFEKKHGTRLGFMSFFVKAVCEALKRFPEVNASIDGDDIVYHGYFDIGIAVGSPRGLVVPILRDADQMSLAEIEATIRDFGARAQAGKLSIEEMTGGTFSVTNGGVFGSLMSTPIINPPQSGILGMHKIQERPMAENGQVVIRPMMYLAHSYDHRIVDGRGAVLFLVAIKELLEDPARILLDL